MMCRARSTSFDNVSSDNSKHDDIWYRYTLRMPIYGAETPRSCDAKDKEEGDYWHSRIVCKGQVELHRCGL